MIHKVKHSKKALKDMRKIPSYILDKLETWVQSVEQEGLENIRKIPGYHDEPLKGDRFGQRSIKLNQAYRAIYKVLNDGIINFVNIEEVSNHEY